MTDISDFKDGKNVEGTLTPVKFVLANITRTKRTETVNWLNDREPEKAVVTIIKINHERVELIYYEGKWLTLSKLRGFSNIYEISGCRAVRFV